MKSRLREENSADLSCLKNEIKQLQQSQEKLLKNKTFNDFSEESKIIYCQTNHKLANSAYQIHKQTIQNQESALESAMFLAIAVECGIENLQIKKSNAPLNNFIKNADEFSFLENSEKIWLEGICYLVGIGNYLQNYTTAIQLFTMAAQQGYKRANHYAGLIYYANEDYHEASIEFYAAANKGYAPAQYELAKMYQHGQGVTQDNKKALQWYKLAAQQGHGLSQANLGFIYMDGKLVSQNYTKAQKWLLCAAYQGNPFSQFNLGVIHHHSLGCIQNYTEAHKWYLLSAQQGNDAAQNSLGHLYSQGNGVKQDHHEAYKWYLLAAQQGNDAAQLNIAHMHATGQVGIQNHTEAHKWYLLSAQQNNAIAQYNVGLLYSQGNGVKQDDHEACKWYLLAAQQGNAIAQYALGTRYEKGKGIAKNEAEASKWYLLSAEQGYSDAQLKLGFLYIHGIGVKQNYHEAYTWYLRAAQQNNVIAQYHLGNMFYYGNFIPINYNEAYQWFLRSAQQGYAPAQHAIGYMYIDGKSLIKNYNEAQMWFLLAAHQDYELAINSLANLYSDPTNQNKDERISARWFRYCAERNNAIAINNLSEKNTLAKQYHAAMIANNTEEVIKLLKLNNITTEELLWDIDRSLGNELLYKGLVKLVKRLKKEMNVDRYTAAINNIAIKRLFELNEIKIKQCTLYNENELTSLYKRLTKIHFNQVPIDQIAPLSKMIVDSWYAVTSIDMDISMIDNFTKQTVNYLTKLIYYLKTHENQVLDNHIIRQCMLILIKHHLGNNYEVIFDLDPPGIKDFLALETLLACSKDVNKINQFFGKNIIKITTGNLIKDISLAAIKETILLLSHYLNQHSEKLILSPALSGLKECLKSFTQENNEQEIKNIMISLITFASETLSIQTLNIFTPREDDQTKAILYYLQEKNIAKLQEVLTINLPPVHCNNKLQI